MDNAVVNWCEKRKWSWENQLRCSAGESRSMCLLFCRPVTTLCRCQCGVSRRCALYTECGSRSHGVCEFSETSAGRSCVAVTMYIHSSPARRATRAGRVLG